MISPSSRKIFKQLLRSHGRRVLKFKQRRANAVETRYSVTGPLDYINKR
jgi:hypothetical protein